MPLNVDDAIKGAISIIESKGKEKRTGIIYDTYSYLHAFSSDKINGFMPNLEGKDVLVVKASGDYTYNAQIKGARSIDTFDINYNSLLYTDLKDIAIESLNLDEFIKFLFKKNITHEPNLSVFNKDVYNAIKHQLPDCSRTFWDELFRRYSGQDIRKSNLFLDKEGFISFVIDNNLYLNKENYSILQSRIKSIKPNFIQSNITELPLNLKDKKYDYMFFSDIASFIEKVYPDRPLEQFSNLILNDFSKSLNKNGEIYVAYLPYFITDDEYVEADGLINNSFNRDRVFTNPPYEIRYFPYFKDDNDLRQDAVLVYKKK